MDDIDKCFTEDCGYWWYNNCCDKNCLAYKERELKGLPLSLKDKRQEEEMING